MCLSKSVKVGWGIWSIHSLQIAGISFYDEIWWFFIKILVHMYSAKFTFVLFLLKIWCFFINLMVNYDEIVPKRHVSINILMKKITFWQILVLKGEFCSVHMDQILVHIFSAKFTFQPHFRSKFDVFSSIWWSILMKLYLNVMFPSTFWWKNITFW